MNTNDRPTIDEISHLLARYWSTITHSCADYVERMSSRVALEIISVEALLRRIDEDAEDSEAVADHRSTIEERLASAKNYLTRYRDMPPHSASENENDVRLRLVSAINTMNQRLKELEDRFSKGHAVHPLHHADTRSAVWHLTGGKCAYCEGDLDPSGKDSASFCIEHVVPRHAGGPDNLANYVPSCHSCNSSKNGSHVLEFIDRRFPGRNRAPVALIAQAPATPEAALALFVEAA